MPAAAACARPCALCRPRQHEPRRQPQQPAHRQRGRHDARQPPARRGIDRKAERRRAAAGSRPARCSRRRARCRPRCRRRRTTGRARARETIATASPFSVANSGVRGVVAREERRRQRLDQHMGGQAEREPHQRLRGRRGIGGGERAVLEQQPHDRLAQHDQSERRRQRQPDREFEAARFGMRHRARSSPRSARVSSGTSTVPMATPTMPSGSSIRRLAK